MRAKIPNIENTFVYEECIGSDRLIIAFSSASASKFEHKKQLENKKVNKLFIRDSSRNWYNQAIPGFCMDADDLLKKITLVTNNFLPSNITCLGSSMGAYAAILFGSKIGAGRIIALGPQTLLKKPIPYTPAEDALYKDLQKVLRLNKARTKIDIWIGLSEISDIYHATHLMNNSNVTIYSYEKSLHNVLAYIKHIGLMTLFYDYVADKNTNSIIPYLLAKKFKLGKNCIQEITELFYINKSYNEVLTLTSKTLRKRKLSALYYVQGVCHAMLNNFDAAISSFNEAIEISPLDYNSLYERGRCRLKTGDYFMAEYDFQAACNSYPSPNASYLLQLGSSQRLQYKYNTALDSLKKALAIDAKNANIYYQLGLTYQGMNQHKEAVFYFEESLKLKPEWDAAVKHMKRSCDIIKIAHS